MTVGGNRLDYSLEVVNSTVEITKLLFLINRTLPIEESEMMMININHYYLGTPLPTYEYIRLPLAMIPEKIIEKYNPKAKAVDSWVYLEIWKGMYGLKHSGLYQINYYNNAWPLLVTNQPDTPQDYGYTRQGKFHSHW